MSKRQWDEADLFQALADVYTDEGVAIWWRTRNRHLGGVSPCTMWRSGPLGRSRVYELAVSLGRMVAT